MDNRSLDNCRFFVQSGNIIQDYYKNMRLNLYNKNDEVDVSIGTDIFNDKSIITLDDFKKNKDFIVDSLTEDQSLIICRYEPGYWTDKLKNQSE